MKITHTILCLFIYAVLLTACAKDEGVEPGHYYGSVKIKGAPLNSIDLDVYYNDTKMGTLNPDKVIGFKQASGQVGKVSICRAGEMTSLSDTVITIPPNGIVDLNAIYSADLNMYGFWNPALLSVPADSVRVMVKYQVTAVNTPKPNAPLEMSLFNGTALTNEIKLARTLTENAFSTPFTLSLLRPGLSAKRDLFYKLKDAVSNAFLQDKRYDNFRLINFSDKKGGEFFTVTITIADDASTPGKFVFTSAAKKVN